MLKIGRQFSKLDYWMIAIIGLLGIMRLPEPLFGDQAIFLVAGKAIRSGAILYRDFWDVKPPGIYGVFTLAGILFGFNEIGMHLFDLLWMLGLACGLRLTLATAFTRPWIAQILPWMAVGSYFALLSPPQQMQVESLVGLPLYFAAWFNIQAALQPERKSRWLLLSGIMGGIVLLFKLIYLPILVAFWLIYLLHIIIRQHQKPLPALWQTAWPLFLGVMLPIGPVILYWLATGSLNEAIYTMIQHPPKMVQQLPKKTIKQLMQSTFWAVRKFFPLMVLSGFAIRYSIRRLNLLNMQMLAWLGLGCAMILAQTQSWWNYHFMLLVVPLSVLAANGIDCLLQSTQRQRQAIVTASLAWLVVVNLVAIGWTGSLMVRSGFDLTQAGQRRYQSLSSHWYQTAITETAFLKAPGSLPGDIYVIGESIFYVLADRGQAVPLLGCVPEIFLKEQWFELISQLQVAKPPYLFVASDYTEPIPDHFMQFLTSTYRPIHQSEAGTWYQMPT
jgi:hypothetical protein